ncbi:hypothetical protein RSK20926_06782 [Roseobacter sp. SK209-2-6]|uniref:MazG-like family protein n=1 Tax=Roseobacter sp. SK209-2-6 TaxID=388739 RepID=UPI0000F3D7E6|nr:MazG-like family protein [Roseobacter sp. SK209-2-6]EBA17421.1 hypothetical protein RSK20926_06782 [Roseobacter sp. SK209-2-6]
MIDFEQLRIANVVRQMEWPGNEEADLAFRALEVADEAGEVMGAIKKLERARRGIAGSTLDLQDVAEELGDTMIALDLLANEIKCGPDEFAPSVELQASQSVQPVMEQALILDNMVGDLSFAAFLLLAAMSAEGDELKPREHVIQCMSRVLASLSGISETLGIDLGQAVAAKFNKTSERYGMATRFETARRPPSGALRND